MGPIRAPTVRSWSSRICRSSARCGRRPTAPSGSPCWGSSRPVSRTRDRFWRARTRLATPALILGANLPDVDVVARFVDADTMYGFRRGHTHGVLAMALLPCVLTGLLVSYARLRPAGTDAPPRRWWEISLQRRTNVMLWTIVAILILLWLAGFAFHVAGGLIHLLLVVALIVGLFQLFAGRRA